MQAQAVEIPLAVQQVPPDQKPKTAQHDEQAEHHVQVPVRHARRHGGERPGDGAHQIEPGVAEGGYRVEHRVPQPPQKSQPGDEVKAEQQRARALHAGGGAQDEPGLPHDAAHLRRGDGFLHDPPLPQPDLAARQNGQRQRHGDHPQPADLDEQ